MGAESDPAANDHIAMPRDLCEATNFVGTEPAGGPSFPVNAAYVSPIIVAGGGNGGIRTHADNAANRIATAVHAEHFDNRWFGGDTITALLLAVF
jgi:hypothetical protein